MKITYFVSQSKHEEFSYELTVSSKNDPNKREICNRWPKDEIGVRNHMRDAIGLAIILGLQSKNDYGNQVSIVIELEVCSIVDPVIKL